MYIIETINYWIAECVTKKISISKSELRRGEPIEASDETINHDDTQAHYDFCEMSKQLNKH